jgi:hypothetical protein
VRSIAETVEQWFYDQLGEKLNSTSFVRANFLSEKQGDLMPYNDPILTVDLLIAKRKELHNATKDIMNKPKPIPKKEEEKKETEETKSGESKSEEKGEPDAKAQGDEPKDSEDK